VIASDITEIAQCLPSAVVEALAGKHILLPGGRGFLGRYFTAVFAELNRTRLADRPMRAITVDNHASSGALGKAESDDGFAHVNGSMLDFNPTGYAFDYVLYLAGIASPAHYRALPLETIDAATSGLRRTLEMLQTRGNPGTRLLFFSSSEIYGDPDPKSVPTKEDYHGNVSCLGPRACYDESKRLGETLVSIYAQRGVSASIVRPFNVYGPGMQHTDYRVLPNFAARIAKGLPLQVYGDGKQTRTYCYVTDAIDGFLRALVLGRPGEPYNIGNPRPELSVLELAEAIGAAVVRVEDVNGIGLQIVPHPASYPADEPNRRCPNIGKASAELGYLPTVELTDGLRRFFRWALANYPKE
jgi:UDP-glucuronate decarboxylase